MKLFILLSFILVILGCQTYTDDYNMLISNNSNTVISFGILYPVSFDRVSVAGVLMPGETCRVPCGVGKPQSWIPIFEKEGDQTIYIFQGELSSGFVDDVNNRSDISILIRYTFSLTDMIQLNWKFTYPPAEDMKNVRMYPPYSECDEN